MKIQVRASLALSVLALVAALGGVAGAVADGVVIGTKQIKNGAVKSVDLRNGGIKSADLKNDGVQSPDLAPDSVEGEAIAPASVEGEELALPEPVQCEVAGEAAIDPSLDYQKVADLCSYPKVDPTSILSVTWDGSVLGQNGGEVSGCTFQIRVNDAPSAQGGGETFGKGVDSASASALFDGLGAVPTVVSVWAKINIGNAAGNRCAVGPDAAGISQTVTVEEVVG